MTNRACQSGAPTPAANRSGRSIRGPMDNDRGSVMVLTLMIMAVMMVIVIASTDTVVTENFIIRNVGIHKENVNLVESALMEGLQAFMQVPDDDPNNFAPNASATDWINDRTDAWFDTTWYDANDVQTILNANNSRVSRTVAGASVLATMAARGEAANGNLRYAVVGWAPVSYGTGGSESLVVAGKPVWHGGRITGEYVSVDAGGLDNGNGSLRMELGVRRQW